MPQRSGQLRLSRLFDSKLQALGKCQERLVEACSMPRTNPCAERIGVDEHVLVVPSYKPVMRGGNWRNMASFTGSFFQDFTDFVTDSRSGGPNLRHWILNCEGIITPRGLIVAKGSPVFSSSVYFVLSTRVVSAETLVQDCPIQ